MFSALCPYSCRQSAAWESSATFWKSSIKSTKHNSFPQNSLVLEFCNRKKHTCSQSIMKNSCRKRARPELKCLRVHKRILIIRCTEYFIPTGSFHWWSFSGTPQLLWVRSIKHTIEEIGGSLLQIVFKCVPDIFNV